MFEIEAPFEQALLSPPSRHSFRGCRGPRENAIRYRIDALCNAADKSLLEDGGRMPEACEAS